MTDDSVSMFDEALIPTDDWRELASLIVRLPDSLDEEKAIAAGVLLNDQETDKSLAWGPILALIVCRVFRRRVEAFEQRLRQRAMDASGNALVDAIAEGDHDKAEKAADLAFNFAKGFVSQEG